MATYQTFISWKKGIKIIKKPHTGSKNPNSVKGLIIVHYVKLTNFTDQLLMRLIWVLLSKEHLNIQSIDFLTSNKMFVHFLLEYFISFLVGIFHHFIEQRPQFYYLNLIYYSP